jgi:hypothetical protein
LLGGVAELVAKQVMEKHMGEFIAEAYHRGRAGKYSRLATGATLAGTALMALAGRRRAGAVAAGALLLAGSLCQRFAVYHAGKISAADPLYTSIPQRERLRS